MIKDTKIEAKQTSTGIWYCSNLPAENVRELDSLIGDVKMEKQKMIRTKKVFCLNTNWTKYINGVNIVHLLYKQKRYIVHDVTKN